jgi:hypothetical protein
LSGVPLALLSRPLPLPLLVMPLLCTLPASDAEPCDLAGLGALCAIDEDAGVPVPDAIGCCTHIGVSDTCAAAVGRDSIAGKCDMAAGA